MEKRHSWLLSFAMSAFWVITSCTAVTISDKPPRITFGGGFLEDRSGWEGYRFPKHLAIDYYTSPGTPILAAANGKVVQIANVDDVAPDTCYDLFVTIAHGRFHGEPLLADYGHLDQLFVSVGDHVKRGQVVGLAARLPKRFGTPKHMEPHLHFELFQPKPGVRSLSYQERVQEILKANDPTAVKTVYDPDKYWLNSKPQCFDPYRDYSNYTNLEFTHPVACGEYGTTLVKKLGIK